VLFRSVIGFIIIAFIVEFLFFFLEIFIYRFIDKRIISSRLNIALGFIPSIISGLILITFFLTVLLSLPVRPDVKQSVINSKIGGFLTHQSSGLENSISKVFGGAVQETLNFLTVKPKGDEKIDLNFKTSNLSIDEKSEDKMFDFINKERADRGLTILSQEKGLLRDVSRAHCGDMFRKGYFSHNNLEGLSPFDRMDNMGISYQVAGENLAFAPTVEIAHTGFMNSPGHKANILSADFGKVGVGVIDGGIYGKMFCQEFTD